MHALYSCAACMHVLYAYLYSTCMHARSCSARHRCEGVHTLDGRGEEPYSVPRLEAHASLERVVRRQLAHRDGIASQSRARLLDGLRWAMIVCVRACVCVCVCVCVCICRCGILCRSLTSPLPLPRSSRRSTLSGTDAPKARPHILIYLSMLKYAHASIHTYIPGMRAPSACPPDMSTLVPPLPPARQL
jgi:hypothetical protein